MDFEKKSLPDLKQMQLNYERLHKTETTDYRTLLATIDRRGNITTGKLEPVALRGFLKLVTELRGEDAVPERNPAAGAALLAEAQQEVFRWASETTAAAA